MSPRISTRLLATQSDQRLLQLARSGHERAFEALVHRYRRPLLRYCARIGLRDGAAEDVLQHSLLRAWLALERQVEVREPRSWLYRIVHNTAVSALASSREDRHGRVAHATAHADAGMESELERRVALRDALSGVAALPLMQREAIVLSALAGQSHEEVADALGVSDGAVRGLLYRARATLRGAAAALAPQPLLSWACGTGAASPAVAPLSELSVPVGAAGMAGMLVKGAAVALTAAVVVAGSAVVRSDRTHAHAAGRGNTAAAITPPASSAPLAAPAATGDGGATVHSAPADSSTADVSAARSRGGRRVVNATHARSHTRDPGSDGGSPQLGSSRSPSHLRPREQRGSDDPSGTGGRDQPVPQEGSSTGGSSRRSGDGMDRSSSSGDGSSSSGDGSAPAADPVSGAEQAPLTSAGQPLD